MEPIINVDPRIYGGEAPNTRDVPTIDPLAVGAGAVPQPYVAPAPVSQERLSAGATAVQEGRQAIAQANRVESTVGQSALAAVKSWSTTRVWDAMNAPTFTTDPDFDVKPYIRLAPVALNETEHKFLAGSRSEEEYNFRLSNLQDQRKLYEQMGDHPFISFAIGAVDPVYLAIDVASMGTASVATAGLGLSRSAGRVIAGSTAAAATLAVGKAEQSVAAVSDGEVLFNALLNGAASATFFNPKAKRMEKVDPTYPSDGLAQAAQRGAVPVEQRVVAEAADVAEHANNLNSRNFVGPRRAVDKRIFTEGAEATAEAVADGTPTQFVRGTLNDTTLAKRGIKNLGPEESAFDVLGRHVNDPDFGPMIRTLMAEQGDALRGVKTRTGDVPRAVYMHDNATVYLDKATSAFTALHETIHGLTTQKINFGQANPGSAHGKLVTELDGLRRQVAKVVKNMKPEERKNLFKQDGDASKSYFTGDNHEFVAGLFAGKGDDFTRIMSQIPVKGARNALTKMVDVVRKLLGVPPGQESALTRALAITDELMRTKLNVKGLDDASVSMSFAPPTGTPTQVAQTVASYMDRAASKTADKLEWSLNKSLRKLGTAGEKIADLLVDNPINMTGNSAVSQRSAIRGELTAKQALVEDHVKTMMAEQGAGIRQRIFNSGAAIKVQQKIEDDLAVELARRDNLAAKGMPHADPNVDPQITKLADLHADAMNNALREMQGGGVRGAQGVKEGPGYATRKWDVTKLETAEATFKKLGATDKQARKAVRDLISDAIIRRDGTVPKDMADDMALAVTERTRRKGYFEDAVGTGTMGDDGAQGIRAILQGSGLDNRRMQQIEDFMAGRKDDAGQMANLKDRIPMDMTANVKLADGSTLRMLDLTDNSMLRNLDGYLDNAAGQSALARKGLVDNSDIVKLRKEFLEGVPSEAERKIAADLFDNTIKAIKGQPVGEEMNRFMRNLSAWTTTIGLANSGWWQLMEYANIATKYGMMKTASEVLARMPGVKQMVGVAAGSVDEAGSMASILSRNSSQDLRMRPFLAKLEDNFTIPVDDKLTLALQQAKQLVPYINAMKFVHHSQANLTANLINDLVQRGVKGDAKARELLAKYGLEGHQLDSMKLDIQTHGMTVDKWSTGTWDNVRGPLNKMMDDAVLKNRTGELPAFAQFSSMGKFIFTFRSFVLGSHNKVLAGTLGRHGFAGLGLLMAYQFPLSMLTSYAVGASKGKPEDNMGKLASQGVSQMSAMGLLSELWGIASGDKQQFGSTGLMAIDRLYKTGSSLAQGNAAQAGAGLAQAVPLLAIMPGVKAWAEQAKTKKKE